jgi:hypothetical protein
MKWARHAVLKPPSAEELARMGAADVVRLWEAYHEAIKNAEEDPLRYGFECDWWGDADAMLGEGVELFVSGGNRCLAGWQEVYDPVTNERQYVEDISGPWHVWAWDEVMGCRVVGEAEQPYIKGRDTFYDVVWDVWTLDGYRGSTVITCTMGHRFYVNGEWHELRKLCPLQRYEMPDGKFACIRSITKDREDDVWDFGVKEYANYFIGDVLNHNSAKTSYGARTVVKAAMANEGAVMWCFAQDETASIRVQQKAVYDWLPQDMKRTIRSGTGYIKYSLKNGFTGSSLILPETKSIISFHTYTQFLNNPGKFEGYELGSYEPNWLNIGWWLDEYLQGPDLVNTLRYRLITRNAKGLLTFTPIDGYTQFVGEYLKGAKTLETRPAALLGGRMIAYRQQAVTRDAGILYAFSEYNPFGGYERMAQDMAGKPEAEILVRAYGHPTKMVEGQFPKFSRDVHVLPAERFEWLKDKHAKVTRYMVLDPAPSKPWYMLWIAVDEWGTWWVYREWPDISYGDWAEAGANGKSKGGPASKPLGFGINDYVNLIQELEGKEQIFERLIDPRMGATPRQVKEGSVTMIEQLDEGGLAFVPASGVEEDVGIAILQTLLSYNTSKPVDEANKPQLYISEGCENTIGCILNYTGTEGYKEAWKDGVDCLRYAAVSEIRYIDNSSVAVTRKGKGGYG